MTEPPPKPLSRDPETSLSTRTMQRYEVEDREPEVVKRRSDAPAMLTLWLLVIAIAGLGVYLLTR